MKKSLLYVGLLLLASCAPYRELEDERLRRAQAEKEKSDMIAQYNNMKNSVDSISAQSRLMMKKIDLLEKDTAMANVSLRNYIRLDAENKKRMDQLSQTTDRILDANLSENERLNSKISLQKQDLEKQKAELEDRIAAFEKQKAEYESVRGSLGAKDERIKELQAALDRKEQAVKDLQTKVDAGGKDALRQLAYILNANPDVNVNVEGHTDNVPYTPKTKGSLVEDNWDLSVLRATNVTKILTGFGVSPMRVTAQGHGEYMPIDPGNSAQARALNRRTEIILSPKIDELLQAID